MISAKTKVYALIGDPVEHSLSPPMHNAAFEALGLDSVYVAFRVTTKNLKRAVEGIKSLEIYGFNVTIPLKVAVIKLLDTVDKKAESIGAVNTVVNHRGELVGYNSDGAGALRALIEEDSDPHNKKVVLLGAGGAARSIAFYLAPQAKELIILNRTGWSAEELSTNLNTNLNTKTEGKTLTPLNLSEELLDADILINATSVGMFPETEKTLVDSSLMRSDLTVFDIVYNPVETLLLRKAREAGAKTLDGVKMLVYQGAQAFQMWTDMKAPIEIMLKTVIRLLSEGQR